jgi:hypothetical protein
MENNKGSTDLGYLVDAVLCYPVVRDSGLRYRDIDTDHVSIECSAREMSRG